MNECTMKVNNKIQQQKKQEQELMSFYERLQALLLGT